MKLFAHVLAAGFLGSCGPQSPPAPTQQPELSPPPESNATTLGSEATTGVEGVSPSAGSEAPNTSPQDPGATGSCSIAIVARDGTRSEYEVQAGGELTIGRESFTDITIARSSVSRRHARVSSESGRCFIEDTNSVNGVYVNDTKSPIDVRTEVGASDRVFLGPVTLHIEPR